MKAILVHAFGGPEVMQLEDVPTPVAEAGQVLVRVKAAGVNPMDTYVRAGAYTRLPSLPYTPGADAAGVVEAMGKGVTSVKLGDRVYLHGAVGAYAEYVACNEAQVHALPEAISFAQGAALGVPYATAWRGLMQRGAARAGQSVLVHGASGSVGSAAVQIARAAGLFVIGTAGTEAGLQLARAQGAHEVLNHHSQGYLDQVMTLTHGHGVDVIVELLANVNLDRDLDVLAQRGKVVVIGNRGRIEIDPRKYMTKDASLLGMSLHNATPEELREIHAALLAGLANGTLRPIIAQELPLAEAARAHVEVMKAGAVGKVVLLP